jgi:hypothetical protein
MLALGTLLGGTVTVGLAAMLLRVGPAPTDTSRPSSAPLAMWTAAPPVAQPDSRPALPLAVPVAPPAAPALSATAASSPPTAPTAAAPSPTVAALSPTVPAPSPTVAASPHSVAAVAGDALGREASLVVQAREALERGDPQGALRAIHAARMLPSHQLGPEELAVEARALRALGRDDQARDVDSTLRKRFPESALAR